MQKNRSVNTHGWAPTNALQAGWQGRPAMMLVLVQNPINTTFEVS
jgi:hypothetical protein